MIGHPFRIEIPRRSRACFLGREPLTPGTEYYSALFESPEGEKIARRDYCLSCWEKKSSEDKPISHWKARIPLEAGKIETQQDHLDHVLELFRESLNHDTEEGRCEAYTLALYLSRKKKLVYRKELKHHGEIGTVYEDPITTETFFVKKVPLENLEEHQTLDILDKRISNPPFSP